MRDSNLPVLTWHHPSSCPNACRLLLCPSLATPLSCNALVFCHVPRFWQCSVSVGCLLHWQVLWPGTQITCFAILQVNILVSYFNFNFIVLGYFSGWITYCLCCALQNMSWSYSFSSEAQQSSTLGRCWIPS